MKLIELIKRFFCKGKSKRDYISNAVAEGFKEAFKEVQYPFERN